MRTDRLGALVLVASLIATPAARAQTPPKSGAPPSAKGPKKAPPPRSPNPAPAPPAPAPPPKAAPPKPPPPKNPEDEAIIEQLELFMLMEMMKDYEILRETDR